MYELIVLMLVSAFVAWFFTRLVIHFALQLGLVHEPNSRSSHEKSTPQGGGVGIVVSTVCFTLWLLWHDNDNDNLTSYWAATGLSLVVAVKGLIDDIFQLSALLRLGIQVLVILALIFTFYTLPIDGLATFNGFPIWLSFILVTFTGVWWLNLFNFMDGIDGLGGSQSVFMLIGAAVMIAVINPDIINTTVWPWMLCLAAASLGFLVLNWSPAKIFMGDTGSMFLAYMIFFLALLTITLKWMSYVSWIILAGLFVCDATITLLRRMLTGQRWLQGHRTHAYQYLARQWGSHQKVTLLFLCVNLFWLFPLAWLSLIYPLESLWFLAIAYVPLLLIANKLGAGKPEVI